MEHDDDLLPAQEKIERIRRLLIDMKNREIISRVQIDPALRKLKQRAQELLQFLDTRTDK